MITLTRFVFCPRCGVAAIEPFGDKGMRCTECGYVYFHNTAAAVAGIIEVAGGIVLTVRAREPRNGWYDLPGGFIDYSETAEVGLRREIREELGVDVTDLRYYGSFPNTYTFRKVTYHTCDMFYTCRCTDADPVFVPSEEIEGYEVVPVNRLPYDRMAFASMAGVLRRYTGQEQSDGQVPGHAGGNDLPVE